MFNINYKNIIYSVALIIIILLYIRIEYLNNKLRKEEERANSYQSAYAAEHEKATIYKDEAGKFHYQYTVANIENENVLKKLVSYDSNFAFIKNMLTKVVVAQVFKNETTHNIYTTLKDSIINDTVRIHNFNYQTKFIDFKGSVKYIIGDTAILEGKLINKDTYKTSLYSGKRDYVKIALFKLRLGPRQFEQEIIPENPDSKIIYNKTLYLSKKKK